MASIFDWIGDINWGGVLDVAAPIVGTYLTTQANKDAANNVISANQQAAAQLQANQDRVAAMLEPTAAATRPGLSYLKTVMAQGSRLAPWQQQELQQRTSDFARGAQKKFNSGRAYTDMANRFYGQNDRAMQEANQQRADNAARQLAGYNVNAETTRATGQSALGQPIANLTTDSGVTAGNINQANAQAYSGGINDIFAAIKGVATSDQKERKSAYA